MLEQAQVVAECPRWQHSHRTPRPWVLSGILSVKPSSELGSSPKMAPKAHVLWAAWPPSSRFWHGFRHGVVKFLEEFADKLPIATDLFLEASTARYESAIYWHGLTLHGAPPQAEIPCAPQPQKLPESLLAKWLAQQALPLATVLSRNLPKQACNLIVQGIKSPEPNFSVPQPTDAKPRDLLICVLLVELTQIHPQPNDLVHQIRRPEVPEAVAAPRGFPSRT